MAAASTSILAGLSVNILTMGAGDSFALDLTNVGAIDSRYVVIGTAPGGFDFTGCFAGTIDGMTPPNFIPPNESYGAVDFDTGTAGELAVNVTGADQARIATYAGGGGWNETSPNWTLDGSPSRYFKSGDYVVFTGSEITLTPAFSGSAMRVSDMTVSGGRRRGHHRPGPDEPRLRRRQAQD